MTAHPFIIVDKATFYQFVQAAPEGYRYEFVRGRIVHAMIGGTVEHSTISRRFGTSIERQLNPDQWLVSSGSDRGVETSVTIRYPDVVLEPSPPPKKSLATLQPVMVVEVLSESSGERDLEI